LSPPETVGPAITIGFVNCNHNRCIVLGIIGGHNVNGATAAPADTSPAISTARTSSSLEAALKHALNSMNAKDDSPGCHDRAASNI
jgi:hypothetical protein